MYQSLLSSFSANVCTAKRTYYTFHLSKMALLCSVAVQVAPLRLCFYLLFYLLLISLFTHITSALITYDKGTTTNLEHLSIICRPFYLPHEFSAVIVTAAYIPPQADTGLALSKLHDVLSAYINLLTSAPHIGNHS